MNDVIAAFAFGALFQLGVTYLTAFPHRRTFPAHVYFASQILSASWIHLYYLGFTQGVFGVYDVAMTSGMITLAAISSIYFTHAQFGLPRPARVWPVLLVTNIFFAACVPAPFDAPRYSIKLMLATLVGVIVYQLVILTRLTLRKPRPFGAGTVLGCWIVLGLMSLDDLPAWAGWGELFGGARGDSAGLAIFAILQSILLAREHIASRQRGDALNVELGDRVNRLEQREQENAHLTEELRRQIADRSRQLFAALALVGTAKDAEAAILAPGAPVQGRYRVVAEHRDLKPANVLVAEADSARPLAKVTDFGVSRLGLDTQTRSSLPPRDSLPPRLIAVSSSTGGSFAGSDDATGIIAPGVIRNRGSRRR